MKRNQKTWAFFGKSAGGGEARLTWAKSSLELLILHVGYGDDGDDDEHNVYDDDDDDDDDDVNLYWRIAAVAVCFNQKVRLDGGRTHKGPADHHGDEDNDEEDEDCEDGDEDG